MKKLAFAVKLDTPTQAAKEYLRKHVPGFNLSEMCRAAVRRAAKRKGWDGK